MSIAVCGGAALVLIGAGIVPERVSRPDVPGWLLVALGAGILLAGLSVCFRIGSPVATRLVGVALLLVALAFAWISLFGDPRHLRGGAPFLSAELNWLLGRMAFGLCALLFLALGIAALRHARHQPGEGVAAREP